MKGRNSERDDGRWTMDEGRRTPDVGRWTAYDVMGRVIGAGAGGMDEAIAVLDTYRGVIFVVCGAQRRTVVR